MLGVRGFGDFEVFCLAFFGEWLDFAVDEDFAAAFDDHFWCALHVGDSFVCNRVDGGHAFAFGREGHFKSAGFRIVECFFA